MEEPHRPQAGAHLANRHAELEGGEDEGGCTSDLGVAAGGGVVFEDEARVHVDGERIADSEGSGGGKSKWLCKGAGAAAAAAPEVHRLPECIQMATD